MSIANRPTLAELTSMPIADVVALPAKFLAMLQDDDAESALRSAKRSRPCARPKRPRTGSTAPSPGSSRPALPTSIGLKARIPTRHGSRMAPSPWSQNSPNVSIGISLCWPIWSSESKPTAKIPANTWRSRSRSPSASTQRGHRRHHLHRGAADTDGSGSYAALDD